MTCATCIHYRPHRDQLTGRVHPSKPGRCHAPVVFSLAQRDQFPTLWLAMTYADRVAERCQRYEAVPVKEKKVEKRKEEELFT